jgi:hypothetical protein
MAVVRAYGGVSNVGGEATWKVRCYKVLRAASTSSACCDSGRQQGWTAALRRARVSVLWATLATDSRTQGRTPMCAHKQPNGLLEGNGAAAAMLHSMTNGRRQAGGLMGGDWCVRVQTQHKQTHLAGARCVGLWCLCYRSVTVARQVRKNSAWKMDRREPGMNGGRWHTLEALLKQPDSEPMSGAGRSVRAVEPQAPTPCHRVRALVGCVGSFQVAPGAVTENKTICNAATIRWTGAGSTVLATNGQQQDLREIEGCPSTQPRMRSQVTTCVPTGC